MTSPISAPFKYNSTSHCLMMWASSELEDVGRIASMEDLHIQYAYALSTVNGMAHLKDALFEYISDNSDNHYTKDLLTIHEKVVRVMKHLISTYNLDVGSIEAFNTMKTLSPLNYLKPAQRGGIMCNTRKNGGNCRKSRKAYRKN